MANGEHHDRLTRVEDKVDRLQHDFSRLKVHLMWFVALSGMFGGGGMAALLDQLPL